MNGWNEGILICSVWKMVGCVTGRGNKQSGGEKPREVCWGQIKKDLKCQTEEFALAMAY